MINSPRQKLAETDYAILKENINKIDFINDVAIYYDKTATQRRIFLEHKNLENWQMWFCTRNNISILKFKQFFDKLSELITETFKDKTKGFQYFELPSELYEDVRDLSDNFTAFNFGYCILMITYKYKIENNYNLIRKRKGQLFLMDEFYYKIEINEFGLFKLEKREISFENIHPAKIYEHSYSFISDSQGYYLMEYDFLKLVQILSNRTECLHPQDFIKMIPDLENGRFEIVGGPEGSNIWHQKPGEFDLQFEKEREDGLFFYTKEVRHADSYSESQHVKDKYGNNMRLPDFYHGLKMLNNGQKYLKELTSSYLTGQVERLK